jgi:hypothetical protein
MSEPDLQECLNHGFKGFKENPGAGCMIRANYNLATCSCVFFKFFKSVVQTFL